MRFQNHVLALAAVGVSSVSGAKFTFTGTNEAGAEFGETVFPGRLGEHYIWPETGAIDVSPLSKQESALGSHLLS
jgi:hypothetical protein